MNLLHFVKREDSGLFYTTHELMVYEEKLGHVIAAREPSTKELIYGSLNGDADVELVHSQIHPDNFSNKIPKFLFTHGEPLSSVGNRVSMRAMVDMASKMEAFICMRKEEWPIWSSLKKTYVITKGIDLEKFKPLQAGEFEKLKGEPAVLYFENWRGQRNPLYLCIAMEKVRRKLPNARLHLYNCRDKKLHETFTLMTKWAKWWTFIASITGPVKPQDVNKLLNGADIVVSCLFPLYARGLEAFGAGKAFIGPGYKPDGYPWTCELDPDSMADAIIRAWENYDKVDYRQWAVDHHNVADSVNESLEIYQRYL